MRLYDSIAEKFKSKDYRFTIHAIERRIERKISVQEIEDAILSGEIIEDYPQDKALDSVENM